MALSRLAGFSAIRYRAWRQSVVGAAALAMPGLALAVRAAWVSFSRAFLKL